MRRRKLGKKAEIVPKVGCEKKELDHVRYVLDNELELKIRSMFVYQSVCRFL
jgi:hypothetical protein